MRKLDNDNPVCSECSTTHYQIEQLEALKKQNQELTEKLSELRKKCGRALWELRVYKVNELAQSISEQKLENQDSLKTS